jgi:endoglucanase
MPTDPKNRQAVSVHYYDPFGFTHLEKDESWAQMRLTWGTTADYDELNGYMDKLKTTFVDKGIPVIVGEYGVAAPNRSESEIRKYTLAVAKAVYERNMCPVLWDVQLADNETQYYYNRKANPPSLVDQQLATGFKEITKSSTPIAHYPLPAIHSKIPTYYTIKGEPVGSTKPAKPGVYLVKQGSSVQKIVVR